MSLLETIKQIPDAQERFSLLWKALENGKIQDEGIATEICLIQIRESRLNKEEGWRLAKRLNLERLVRQCEEELVSHYVASGQSYKALEFALREDRKDLALKAAVEGKNYEQATVLAYKLKDPRKKEFFSLVIEKNEEHYQKYRHSPANYSSPIQNIFSLAELCSDTDEKKIGRDSVLKGIKLALREKQYKTILKELQYGKWRHGETELFTKKELEKMQAQIYLTAANHLAKPSQTRLENRDTAAAYYISAARLFKEVGENKRSAAAYKLAIPMLHHLEKGIEIAEKEYGDSVLAFDVAQCKALNGSDWGRFYRLREAAERARTLGKEKKANDLYAQAIKTGLKDDPGFGDMDGGTNPDDILKWSDSFKGPTATMDLFLKMAENNSYYSIKAIEYAVKNDLVNKIKKMAAAKFKEFNREGDLHAGLKLAKVIGDAEKQKFYHDLLK